MRRLKAILVTAALAAAGCMDIDQEITLNPDGSGRAVVKSLFAPNDFFGTKSDPDELAKKAVRTELEKAEGIDAWKDVEWSTQDDGKVRFQATAYFKDVSKVKFHHQGMNAEILQLKMTKSDAGEISVECPSKRKAGEAAPAKLSEDEIRKRMKKERAQYQQMKPMLDGLLGSLKFAVKVNLPAKVASTTNFKKAGESAVTLGLDGKAFARAFGDFVMDDEKLRAEVEGGFDLEKPEGGPPAFLVAGLFGEKGPIRAVLAGDAKPLFDYETEASAARATQAAIYEKVGGPLKVIVPPAKGGAFKSVKVAGIRIVHLADGERGVTPFSEGKQGISLSILAEFPGSVLTVKEGKLEKAVSDDGKDLLPEQEWERTISFPRLTNDKAAALIEFSLAAPGESTKFIKEVSGTLLYTVGGKIKEEDLGITEFKTGSAGTLHGAKIRKLEDNTFAEGHQDLDLELQLSNDHIQEITFFDEKGNALEAVRSGYGGGDSEVTISFSLEGRFPPKGRILIKVHDDVKTFETPFTISNIDLTGRPVK